MKLLHIPKLPKFKLPRPRRQPPKKLEARLRASSAATVDPYDEEERQTKLTGALIVVAVLHIVAVGGIYAFNQIKTSRRDPELALHATIKPETKPTTQIATPTEQPKVAAPLIQAPVSPVARQRVYNVKPGDTLTSISKACNVSIADLKATNGFGNDIIRPGQVLNLPAAKAPTEVAHVMAKTVESIETKPATKAYTVKSGDRLIFIARKFGVTQEDLIAMNKIKDPTKLQIGQTIKIPTKKAN